MSDALPILADGAEDLIKFIFIAIFVFIWIVGGLMSATKKKRTPTRAPEKSWDEIFRDLSGEAQRPQPQQPPPPMRPRPVPAPPQQVRRPMPIPASNAPSGPATRKKLRRRQRVQAPPQVSAPPLPPPSDMTVLEVSTETLPPMPADISGSEIGTGKARTHRIPNAEVNQIRSFLRPDTLRSQFILTELLQPPKALRQEI